MDIRCLWVWSSNATNASIFQCFNFRNLHNQKHTHTLNRQCLVFRRGYVYGEKQGQTRDSEWNKRADKEKNILSILINVTKKCRTFCVCVCWFDNEDKKWDRITLKAKSVQNHSLAVKLDSIFDFEKNQCVSVSACINTLYCVKCLKINKGWVEPVTLMNHNLYFSLERASLYISLVESLVNFRSSRGYSLYISALFRFFVFSLSVVCWLVVILLVMGKEAI